MSARAGSIASTKQAKAATGMMGQNSGFTGAWVPKDERGELSADVRSWFSSEKKTA
jgi:hypothetical protein